MPIQGGMGQPRGDQDSINSYAEQLRRQLAERIDRARQNLAETSTVPIDAFDLQDPILEAALSDSTMQFFLEHMTMFNNLDGAIEANTDPHHEAISRQDLQATYNRVAGFDTFNPPDLHQDVDTERFWIIADLVSTGDALSQHRATIEIRALIAMAQQGDIRDADAAAYYRGLQAMADRSILLNVFAKVLARQLCEDTKEVKG